MVDRAILFSDPKFQQDNLHFVIKVLLNNDYLLNFIFDTVNTRLKFLSNVLQQQKKHRHEIKRHPKMVHHPIFKFSFT